MRSNKEIAAEALRRAAEINQRRRRRRKRWITAALTVGLLAPAVCLVVLQGRYSGAGPPAQAVVVSLYGEKAGGYALAGAIGFSLGAAVMFMCLRRREGGKKDNTIEQKEGNYL